MKEFITRKEAAERALVCIATIDKHIRDGSLQVLRPSPKRIIIPVENFEKWIAGGCGASRGGNEGRASIE